MKIFIPVLFTLFSLAPAANTLAQAAPDGATLQTFRRYEDSLILTADSMYSAGLPEMRQDFALVFIRQLKGALSLPGSYSYGFDSLARVINILPAPDGAFRIFNWATAPTEITRRYYGAIQLPGESLKLYGLVDYSTEIGKAAEDTILTNGRWYGALYYRIMPLAGTPGAYTLFGLNSASPLSNKKVLDVLTLTPQGPRFGAPIFGIRSQATRGRVARFILEYKKEVQASMNWDERLGAIYYDRLMSPSGDEGRKYTFVPSGQYDGFRWNGNEWTLVRDVVPVLNLKDGDLPVGGAD